MAKNNLTQNNVSVSSVSTKKISANLTKNVNKSFSLMKIEPSLNITPKLNIKPVFDKSTNNIVNNYSQVTEQASKKSGAFSNALKNMGQEFIGATSCGEKLSGVFGKLDAISLDSMIGKVGKQLQPLIEETLPVIKGLVNDLIGAILPLEEKIIPMIAGAIGEVIPVVMSVAEEIVPLIIDGINQIAPLILEIAETVIPIISEGLCGFIPLIQMVAEEIIPILIDAISQILPFVSEFAESILPVLFDMISQIVPFILQIAAELLPILIEAFVALLPIIMEFVENILPILIDLFNTILPLIMELATTLLPPLIEVFLALLPPIMSLIAELLPPMIDLFASIIGLFIELSPIIILLAKVLGELLIGALKFLMPHLQNLIKFSTKIIDAIKGVVKIFKDVINDMLGGLEKVINKVVPKINKLLKGINAVGGVIGVHIKPIAHPVKLPRLRVGLDYVPNDDFPALLHRGEMVLTKEESDAYRKLGGLGGIQNMFAFMPFAPQPQMIVVSAGDMYLDGDKISKNVTNRQYTDAVARRIR